MNEIQLLTSEKVEFLKLQGWNVIDGYCFNYSTDDFDCVIISREEVNEKIKNSSQWYCQRNKDEDNFMDLDDAMEDEREWIEDNKEVEFDDEAWINYVRLEIKRGKQNETRD